MKDPVVVDVHFEEKPIMLDFKDDFFNKIRIRNSRPRISV